MELRILCLLAITATSHIAFAAKAIGSGDGESAKIITATDDDDDFTLEDGSGSGDEPSAPKPTPIEQVRVVTTYRPEFGITCTRTQCYCQDVYDRPIHESAVFGAIPTNCSKYPNAMRPPTTNPTTILPTRSKETERPINEDSAQPHHEKTATESVLDWSFETMEEEKTTKAATLAPVVLLSSPTKKQFDNRVPGIVEPKPTPKVNNDINEEREDKFNIISGADSQINSEAVKKDELAGGLFIEHPGILAAIIGGGVVGLLCAILLVMFIIYRMRKKDEGSYPLNDSKPLKNYAYAKAPSKEFYA